VPRVSIPTSPTDRPAGGGEASGDGQLPLEFANTPSHDEADFVVGEGNRLAYLHLTAWPSWPGPLTLLIGPAKSGKSHLARIWAAHAKAIVIGASELSMPPDGAVVVEDCDGAGSARDAALFALLERGGPLLLTARTAPVTWTASLPDLASRFRALVAFELGSPDEALLMSLAVKLFADRQLLVPEAVVTALVRNLERTPAAIRAFIAKADREALRLQKPVNLQLIRGLMVD